MSNPFFFGSSKSPLYGVYHPPVGSHTTTTKAVLLCAPVFHEYIRTHKILRQLATTLAHNGYSVLRFDYFGNGDSAGYSNESSTTRWINDISEALHELRDRTEAKNISIIGMRLGATLSIAALLKETDFTCAHLILWDPVIQGNHYLNEISVLHSHTMHQKKVGTVTEKAGFEYPDSLWKEIQNQTISHEIFPQCEKLTLLCTEFDALSHTFHENIKHTNLFCTKIIIENNGDYTNHKLIDQLLIDNQTIQIIATILKDPG